MQGLDLNLLRLFDAVYLERNVSRAAERLNLTQPTASQALTRLRLALGDPLFERAPGGVRPTPRAQRLAPAIQMALAALDDALRKSAEFDPSASSRVFQLHLSDIGEARFLPALMARLRQIAPGIGISCRPVPHDEIASALDSGRLDLALGFLPGLDQTRQSELLHDRYVVLVRERHPLLDEIGACGHVRCTLDALQRLDFAAVRSHDETLRILQLLGLEHRLRLTVAHFLTLPDIVKATDLAVLMPLEIARGFATAKGYAVLEPDLPSRHFTVSLHWSRRFEAEPGNSWLRHTIAGLFARDRE